MNDVGDLYALMRQAQSQRDAATARAEAAEAELAKVRADLAAAQQALRAATEWRPIETAPRDGTWIFTRDKHDPAQPIACRWQKDCKAWQDFFGEVWASETHWLPIPPLAQEAQGS